MLRLRLETELSLLSSRNNAHCVQLMTVESTSTRNSTYVQYRAEKECNLNLRPTISDPYGSPQDTCCGHINNKKESHLIEGRFRKNKLSHLRSSNIIQSWAQILSATTSPYDVLWRNSEDMTMLSPYLSSKVVVAEIIQN